MRSGWLGVVVRGTVVVAAILRPSPATARPASAPPPLAAPEGAIVRVSNELELQAAVQNLRSNTSVVLAAGTYRLTSPLRVNGTFSKVAIRGATNNRSDVLIIGPGMTSPRSADIPFGIWTGGNVQRILIANLTIRDFPLHPIIFNAGTQSPHVYNVRLVNAGQQFIKSNPDGAGGGVNNGIIEYSVLEYTTAAPGTYTNGIDVHTGANWIVRHNLFRNIVASSGLAGPAVLMWNHSRDTLTEGNLFLNCARGIAYGLQVTGLDHTGGIIRNNIFFRSSAQPGDVGISVADSPDTQVLNNTVLLSGTYQHPIEYRFESTRKVLLANNLLDGPIGKRDNASGIESHNVVSAGADWFVNAPKGDFHLTASATAAIDSGVAAANVTDAWDGWPRPQGAAFDIGADEYRSAPTTVAPARSEPTERASSGDGRLISERDLAYQGAFRLPSGTFGGSNFAYGATAMAFNPERGSLFVVGHDWHQQVAEISVPAVRNATKLAELATATVLQPFADVTDGKLAQIGSGAVKLGGLFVHQGQLYATGYVYYDAGGSQVRSHFVSGLDLRATSDGRGPYRVGTVGAGFVSGYFAAVPRPWQPALGGPVLNGNCCLNVITRTSFGPAAFTMDPASLSDNNPAPANALVYYPTAHPLLQAGATGDGFSNNSTLFNGTTEIKGAVFPEGTASVLFFGRQGLGTFCYGPGVTDSALVGKPADGGVDRYCYDPASSSKGTHAYPYAYYVWAYDANALAEVRAGRKKPWDVKPYAVWKLTFPFPNDNAHLGGAAYDSKTGRIFIAQAFGDGELPLIHVFTTAPRDEHQRTSTPAANGRAVDSPVKMP